jgi:adenylate cyclase
VEFASVVDAVRCAVDIQRQMAERNAVCPPNAGSSSASGSTSATLSSMETTSSATASISRLVSNPWPRRAQPASAGRCATRYATSLNFSFEDMGEQQVKNITRPIRTHRIVLSGAADAITSAAPTPRSAAQKPSIVVLPFANLSGGAEQEYFSDGITEDIITNLSRNHAFFVISRSTSFTYKGPAIDIGKVARDLGVRYVLEGSVRRAGDRVRITAQLIDAASGHHLWADRYDRELADVFAVQDEIAWHIIGAIAPGILSAEVQHAQRKEPSQLDAWDRTVRAHWHIRRFTEHDLAEARRRLPWILQIP